MIAEDFGAWRAQKVRDCGLIIPVGALGRRGACGRPLSKSVQTVPCLLPSVAIGQS